MKVIAIKDYDGYFENLVNANLKYLSHPTIQKIYITAGPYRSYGSAYDLMSPLDVHIDFYAATRMGFGSTCIKELFEELSEQEFDPHTEHLPGFHEVLNYIAPMDEIISLT